MTILQRSLLLVGLLSWSLCSFAQPLETASSNAAAEEWVVVFDDPRPARLKGWSRGGYTKRGNYENSLELTRFGSRMANRYDFDLKDQWFIKSLNVYCLVVKFNGDQDETLNKLKEDKQVQWVQPSNEFQLLSAQPLTGSEPGKPSFAVDENLKNLPSFVNGEGVVIAIVDSGVDNTHPDLSSAVQRNEDFVGAARLEGEAHGTAIAGVIASKKDTRLGMAGVAPKARLDAYRGCWENTTSGAQCNTLSLARALDAVLENRADILNLSLSGPKDALLDRLIDGIIEQGTVVVAAFDPRREQAQRFPSPRNGVLIVRAEGLDQANAANASALVAPGARIVATPGSGYDYMQGHSVATAYTAGILALYKQAHASNSALFELDKQWSDLTQSKHVVELVDKLSKQSS